MDMSREVPGGYLLYHKELRRADAAAVDADDVGVVEAGHDLELMLKSGDGTL